MLDVIVPNRRITDAIAARLAPLRATAARRYRELLAEDVADDARIAELADLMLALGKTTAQLENDQIALAAARSLKAKIAAGEEAGRTLLAATRSLKPKIVAGEEARRTLDGLKAAMGELLADAD